MGYSASTLHATLKPTPPSLWYLLNRQQLQQLLDRFSTATQLAIGLEFAQEQRLLAGMKGYLSKPINRQQLEELLHKWLD